MMTKIILEGKDALNYIEMLNRIKELEQLVKKQSPLDVGASANSGVIKPEPQPDTLAGRIQRLRKEPKKTLSDAIDAEQPQQETVHRTDLPKDFIHDIEEEPASKPVVKHMENLLDPETSVHTPDQKNWIAFVEAGFPHVSKNKHWKPYEELAIVTASDMTEDYFSIATLAKFLGRTESSVKTKAINMGYKTKKGMIKS
jgi:hypothetical protein